MPSKGRKKIDAGQESKVFIGEWDRARNPIGQKIVGGSERPVW